MGRMNDSNIQTTEGMGIMMTKIQFGEALCAKGVL